MVWQNIGFVMVIYLAGLANVPAEMEEAAALDGASTWRRFRTSRCRSIQPVGRHRHDADPRPGPAGLRPGAALTGGGPAGATETLATQVYKQTFTYEQFGFGAALALLLSVLILVFSIVQQCATRDRARPEAEPCSATRRGPSSIEIIMILAALIMLLPFWILLIAALKTRRRGPDHARRSRRPRTRRGRTSSTLLSPPTGVGQHLPAAC